MRENLSSENFGMLQNKSVLFRLIKKNAKPALKGRYYPSQKLLPSEETVFDSSINKRRMIRYAPSEQSIYKDEQPDKVVLGSVIFQNGSLIVPHDNPILLEFLEKSNYNQGNLAKIKGSKAKFNLVNPAAVAKVNMEIEVSQIRAATQVLNMDFSDLKAYARVLGVNITNSGDIIRHDMLQLAKKDPAKFMAGVDDPLVKRQQVILDAMQYKFIEVTGRNISWLFDDKKSLIVPVPLGQDAVAWFAQWTMNEKNGEEVYADIEKKVEKLSAE
jgi:hypothetical protein